MYEPHDNFIPKEVTQYCLPFYEVFKRLQGILADVARKFTIDVYEIDESRFVKTEETADVITTPMFNLNMPELFLNRKIVFYNLNNTTDLNFNAAAYQFAEYWIDYKNRMRDNWSRIIGARSADFSPIANYDKYLDGTLKYKGSEVNSNEPSGKETRERTESGSEAETNVYGAKTETDTFTSTTFDSSDFNDNSKNTKSNNSYTDTSTRTYNNRKSKEELTFTDRIDENTKSFVNRQDENSLHEFGNIGVAKTTDIIKDYIELYRKDIAIEILTDFMDEISFY